MKIFKLRLIVFLFTFFLISLFFPQTQANAATFNLTSNEESELIDTINTAETNGEPDTINLLPNVTYQLTQGNWDLYGTTGLPIITTEITINGNGSILYRNGADAGTGKFRILAVDHGNLTLDNITIRGGDLTSTGGAAGIFIFGGNFKIKNSLIEQNHTSGFHGGGLGVEGAVAEIDNTTITGNTGYSGGGITNFGGTLTIKNNSRINGNTADFDGGGINNIAGGHLTIESSQVVNNQASMGYGTSGGRGGGILDDEVGVDNFVTITSSLIHGNYSTTQGGGFYSEGGSEVSITNTDITGNQAVNDGGGIFFASSGDNGILNVTNSQISGNTSGVRGGGVVIYNGVTTNFDSTKIEGNTSAEGSAVSNIFWANGAPSQPGLTQIHNSCISGNNSVAVANGVPSSTIDATNNWWGANGGGPGGAGGGDGDQISTNVSFSPFISTYCPLDNSEGIINTTYGILAQPFVAAQSKPIDSIDLSLCTTGNNDDLQGYTNATVKIINYDEEHNSPVYNDLLASGSIDMYNLPNCNSGYGNATAQFVYPGPMFPPMGLPQKPSLIAGKKYAILLQASAFNDTDNSLRWEATAFNSSIGNLFRNPNNNGYYSLWWFYHLTGVFSEHYLLSETSVPVIDQSNIGGFTDVGIINTDPGALAQTFTASTTDTPLFFDFPLCITGNTLDGQTGQLGYIELLDFDTANNKPITNAILAQAGISRVSLPDCSVGYSKVSAYFPRVVNLIAGKRYAISLKTAGQADRTLHWAATSLNNAVGNLYSNPNSNGTSWTALNMSGSFVEYINTGVTPPNQQPTVDAGGPYDVNETASVQVSATGNDPENQTLTYSWDLDNNGSFETPGQSVSFSAASLTPGVKTIKVKAVDPENLFATDEATVNILDIPTFDDFIVLGKEGIWLKQNAIIHSGDVGANTPSGGPFLDSSVEASIGQGVTITDSQSDIFADSIKLKSGSQVMDVFYNDISNNGTILGTSNTPQTLPVVPAFPNVPSFSAGVTDVTVAANTSQTLSSGSYKDLVVNHDATLTLSGGVYNFNSWDLRDDTKIYFSAATEIRVAGKLNSNIRTQIKPAAGSGITTRDIKIFVTGINGGSGNVGATPKAAEFGQRNVIEANVYAPNGTLFMKEDTTGVGAFLGKWVVSGESTELSLQNGF